MGVWGNVGGVCYLCFLGLWPAAAGAFRCFLFCVVCYGCARMPQRVFSLLRMLVLGKRAWFVLTLFVKVVARRRMLFLLVFVSRCLL